MTLKVADQNMIPGQCREMGCHVVVSSHKPTDEAVVLHIFGSTVDTYVPSEADLDDLHHDIWADVRVWAEGLHR